MKTTDNSIISSYNSSVGVGIHLKKTKAGYTDERAKKMAGKKKAATSGLL